MASSPLVVPSHRPRSAPAGGASVTPRGLEGGWHVVAAIGAAFSVVGLFDLALTWYPAAFGSPEWEFGTVTATLDGMPVPVMGLGLALAAALAGRARVTARLLASLFLALAVALAGLAVLWATTLPFAFEPVTNDVVRLGLYKAVAKTALQLVVYPILFVVLGVAGWRRSAR